MKNKTKKTKIATMRLYVVKELIPNNIGFSQENKSYVLDFDTLNNRVIKNFEVSDDVKVALLEFIREKCYL